MRAGNDFPNDKTISTVALVFLLPLSLVLTATVNRLTGDVLDRHCPTLSWITTAAIPSFVTIAGCYAFFHATWVRDLPADCSFARRSVLRLAIGWLFVWLAGCGVYAVIRGQWEPYARGWPALAAFLIFGPAGEELLFRGLIYGHARVLLPRAPWAAVLLSTLAFSLHHLSLHTAPKELALAQLLFTLPMGIVLCLIRERTGRIWPSFLVHVATNLPAAF